MNELQAVVNAYAEVRARGGRAALATVVSVVGSAYRRPGARMLVTEDGQTVGAISGGCLERDAVEHARQVITSDTACVVEYDTRGDEDIVWGLGLGCNGVVRVLLESLHEGSGGARALQFVADCLRVRKSGVIATVIDAGRAINQERGAADQESGADRSTKIGARLPFDERDDEHASSAPGGLFVDALSPFDESGARIREDARVALTSGRAMTRVYEAGAGRTEIFFDVICRPRPLVVFGAEHDAAPLIRLAQTLGWHVTVVDTRARRATRERFASADSVVLCRAEDVTARFTVTRDTVAVVMTHSYLDDVELLRALLPSPACYVGILGPKQRTEKLLAQARAEGSWFTDAELARLHSPVGIDIGAETPEEIALSVVAEIKAACDGRGAGFLRDRNAPIHDERAATTAPPEFEIGAHAAARERATSVACGSSS